MELQALKRLARSRKNWNPRTVDKLYDLYRKSAFGAVAGGIPDQKFVGGELVSLRSYQPTDEAEQEQFEDILFFHPEPRPLYWIVHENLNGNYGPIYARIDPNNPNSPFVWWYTIYTSSRSIDSTAIPDQDYCIIVPETSLKLERVSPTPPGSPQRLTFFD